MSRVPQSSQKVQTLPPRHRVPGAVAVPGRATAFTTPPTPDHGSPARPAAGGSCSRRRCASVTLSRRPDLPPRALPEPSPITQDLRLLSRAGDHPARRRPPLFSSPPHPCARS